MTVLSHPIYILAHFADTAGCGHHRIMRPMEIMASMGYITGRCDMALWPKDRLLALDPDVVVWQRQLDDLQVKNMQDCRDLLPNAFFVYEIDDNMGAVPQWSPHAAYVPPDVDDRMARAISVCDAVSVTTRDMANHIHEIAGKHVDVRVIPNMLAEDELQRVAEVRANNPAGGKRIRIGWGGGFSHAGDLELIIPAMREFYNRVDFVFLGQKPDCEVPVEFHQGVPPKDYLTKLASLRIDLMLAPLQDNRFNECKSNLRLIEAGAIGCPVIASHIAPYVTDAPPVLRYANSPQEWIDAIGKYLEDPTRHVRRGEQLRRWVREKYLMNARIKERVQAWLPENAVPFVPNMNAQPKGVTIYTKDPVRPGNRHKVTSSFTKALFSHDDIVYLREGTLVTEDQIDRLLLRLDKPHRATVMPMSNDGGAASFPQVSRFTSIEALPFSEVDGLCASLFGGVEAEVSNPAGPVILISRKALEISGYPDIDDSTTDIEAALIEWGVATMSKGFEHMVCADTFVTATLAHPPIDGQPILNRCSVRYSLKNLSPDPLAPVRQELELFYHRKFYRAPLPSQNITYAEWAALFTEVGDRDMAYLAEHMPEVDITPVVYPCRYGDLPDSEWLIFTREGSQLVRHAPYVFAAAIDDNVDVIYADHDYIQPNGLYDRHDFKPHSVDYHMLMQRDYITPVFAMRMRATGLRLTPDFVIDEITLYSWLLYFVKNTPERVRHVARVLAHVPERLLPEIMQITAENCQRAIAATGLNVVPHPRFPALGEIHYADYGEQPKVLIVMPTGGKLEMLAPCLTSLLGVTDYPNFEVLVIENGTVNLSAHEYLVGISDPRVRVVYYDGDGNGYNWSAINNWAEKWSRGDDEPAPLLLLLNDDTRFYDSFWLKEMVGCSNVPRVGAVGARLLYPNGMVQHVGVVSRFGLCGHIHKGLFEANPGYNGIAALSHESTAVTGACLLIRRELFTKVGGLKEKLAHNFNDVALCLDLLKLGYVNVVAARAMIHHFEGVTRTNPTTEEGGSILRSEADMLMKLYPQADPYWNDNLHFAHTNGGMFVSGLNYDQLQWPIRNWEWREAEDWTHETILLVGDDGTAWVEHARAGDTLYYGMLNGYGMQIVRPSLVNLQPFDIRESGTPQQVLVKLGVNKIVVRSILGGTDQVLAFLANLGLPIEYRPSSDEAVCPRTDLQTRLPGGEFGDCGRGWERGECQACINGAGSPFGAVSIAGWRDQWRRFLTKVDTVTARDGDSAKILDEMYL